ncbi:MAG: serpin family protein [Dehalococcoidales bacterium]|nr:serpin family protein [Dehalococcoidales bacterium]
MKKFILIILVSVMMLGVISCSQPVAGQVIQSDKPCDTSPDVSSTDLETLVEGNGNFTWNLYQVLKNTDGNVFYSPYSISEAMAMTYAGANGETAAQMADAMQFLLAQNALHPAFNYLDLLLAQRGEGAEGKDGEGFRLNVVNAIWGQKDFKFQGAFLDVLAENYGAGLRILDFQNKPEDSRVTINDWVAGQTEDRIKDLIPQGAIDGLTRLVLTNAIYFNAAWQLPFNEESTTEGTFYNLSGSTTLAQMMHQSETYAYTDGDNYQAIELPYDGAEISMVILLPDSGKFTEFQNALGADIVKDIIGNLQRTQVVLTMPKFEFESSFNLNDALKELGMTDAFNGGAADFSGMTGDRSLYISDVIHRAFVSVDEAGTEAAAATAVIMKLTAMPAEEVTMTIDRPFIFFIRDIQTGAILFVGQVVNLGE